MIGPGFPPFLMVTCTEIDGAQGLWQLINVTNEKFWRFPISVGRIRCETSVHVARDPAVRPSSFMGNHRCEAGETGSLLDIDLPLIG